MFLDGSALSFFTSCNPLYVHKQMNISTYCLHSFNIVFKENDHCKDFINKRAFELTLYK